LVRIGIGRDAAEVAFATPFGLINPGPIKIWIERSDGQIEVDLCAEEDAANAGAD
jgi:hypothetical protein